MPLIQMAGPLCYICRFYCKQKLKDLPTLFIGNIAIKINLKEKDSRTPIFLLPRYYILILIWSI